MFEGFQPRPHMTGYTSLPNEFFEPEVLSDLKEAELKIMLATFRKTYGWISHVENGVPVYKLEDDISYSQYREMTGLTDSSISSALQKLIKKGYLVRTLVGDRTGQPSRYKIRVKGDAPDDGAGLDREENMGTIASGNRGGNGDNTFPPATTTDSLTPDELFSRPARTPANGEEKRKGGNFVRTFSAVWKDCCRRKQFFSNAKISTQREMKHIKDMAAEYGEETVLKAAEFFVIYYPKIAERFNINSPEPTVITFYGFRRSIIPLSLQGPASLQQKTKSTSNAGREFDETKFQQGGGDYWNT